MSERPSSANTRTYTAVGEAESLGGQLKHAVFNGYELLSDESASFGGGGTAPKAMDYFVAAIMF